MALTSANAMPARGRRRAKAPPGSAGGAPIFGASMNKPATKPSTPAPAPRRIPIRVVSRAAIERLVASFNASTVHAE